MADEEQPALMDVNLDVHDRDVEQADAAMAELEELNAADPLAFQDLASPSSASGAQPGGGLGAMDADRVETESLLSSGGGGGGPNEGAQPAGGVCSLSFYQQFFDVTTAQVKGRLRRAIDPRSASFFVDGDRKPDLYGPFWIATTLIFLMAASGNFARYLTTSDLAIRNDFGKVTVAASLLYSAVTVVPLGVWFFLRRIGQEKQLVEVVCLYGYSLFVFVPACVVCVAPFEWLRWIMTVAAFAVSTRFLLRNVWNYFALAAESRSPGYVLLGIMVLFQLAVSFMLKVYFFETTGVEDGAVPAAAEAPAPAA